MSWLSGCRPIRGHKCSRINLTVWLQELLEDEANGGVPIDLREVTLVDQASVRFLVGAEARRIQIVNCLKYVRSWIATKRRWSAEESL